MNGSRATTTEPAADHSAKPTRDATVCGCRASVDLFHRSRDIVRHLEAADREWRQLGEIWGKHIANARGQMETAIVALTQAFADIVRSLDELVATARWLEGNEGRLTPVLGAGAGADCQVVVEQLEHAAVRLETEAAKIRVNVEAALVHLQFQDRVNQILGHVETNIRTLPDALADVRGCFELTGRLPPLDFSPLLAAIEASYTTDEERAAHRGCPAAGEVYEITYF
jgi:hypothetical protein